MCTADGKRQRGLGKGYSATQHTPSNHTDTFRNSLAGAATHARSVIPPENDLIKESYIPVSLPQATGDVCDMVSISILENLKIHVF